MAVIETWFDCFLGTPIKIHYPEGTLFSGDTGANQIGIRVYNQDGTPANLSGTVTAKIIRSDGTTITANGTLSGNSCSVVLPQNAYSIPGPITVTVRITTGGAITSLGSVVLNVYDSFVGTITDLRA